MLKWFSLIRLYLILSFSRFIINKNIGFNNKNYNGLISTSLRYCSEIIIFLLETDRVYGIILMKSVA